MIAKHKFGISERSFSLILEELIKHKEIEKVVIFGSRAMGNEKKGSDIDLAILGNKVKPELIRKLKILFNERYNIPYFVDVLLYEDISNLQLKNHIKNEGKIILSKKTKIRKKQPA